MSTGRVLGGILLVAIVAVVVGQLLGQPFLLGFVETGSMRPTLDPGDGFVAVPPALVGGVEAGDVITYRAVELHGGGLTTHRVVEVTDAGLVTAGDANPFTDQAAGEPRVPMDRVVAVAIQVDGHVLVIPELGTAIGAVESVVTEVQAQLATLFGTRSFLGVRGLAVLLLAASIVGYIADVLTAHPRKSRRRDRDRTTGYRPAQLVFIVAIIVALAATVAMVAPSGVEVYPFDSVAPGASVQGGIVAGTERSVETTVTNAGLVPTYVVFTTDNEGVSVPQDPVLLGPRDRATVPITLTAPTEPGRYWRTVTHHRYLAVLPPSVVMAAHTIHPWLAIAAVDVTIVAGFLVAGHLLVGRGRIRVTERRTNGDRVTVRNWIWGPDRPGD
ncbi:MAG: S26 family signal peptidase [Halobacteriaceae archaeon]